MIAREVPDELKHIWIDKFGTWRCNDCGIWTHNRTHYENDICLARDRRIREAKKNGQEERRSLVVTN